MTFPGTLIGKNGQPFRAKEFLHRENLYAKSASFSPPVEESGMIYEIGAVDLVASLPLASAGKGVVFSFIVKTVSETTGFSISPTALNKIVGNGFTEVVDKDLINTAATDRKGDLVVLMSDGVDSWYVIDIIGTWAKES